MVPSSKLLTALPRIRKPAVGSYNLTLLVYMLEQALRRSTASCCWIPRPQLWPERPEAQPGSAALPERSSALSSLSSEARDLQESRAMCAACYAALRLLDAAARGEEG